MQSQRSFKSGKIAFITFLCLVGITLIVGAFKFCIRTPVVPSVFTDTSSSDFDENTEKWGQLGISEQYPQVLVGGVPYTSRAHKISIEQITKAIIWLLVANIIALFIITYIPAISMTIPKLMGLTA